jgi:hypothetical protein
MLPRLLAFLDRRSPRLKTLLVTILAKIGHFNESETGRKKRYDFENEKEYWSGKP